jgi:hypothetical protein
MMREPGAGAFSGSRVFYLIFLKNYDIIYIEKMKEVIYL